jgi:hypothetical protein
MDTTASMPEQQQQQHNNNDNDNEPIVAKQN